MKKINYALALIVATLLINSCRTNKPLSAPEPLKSWKNEQAKSEILSFVDRIDDAGKTYIGKSYRTAVLEVDELFLSVDTEVIEREYIIYAMEKLVEKSPYLNDKPPYKDILSGDKQDFPTGKYKHLAAIAFNGMTLEEYRKDMKAFMRKVAEKNGKSNVDGLIQKEGPELAGFLVSKGFDVYVISSLDTELMRAGFGYKLGVDSRRFIGESNRIEIDSISGEPLRTGETIVKINANYAETVYRKLGGKPMIAVISGKENIEMLKMKNADGIPTLSILLDNDAEQEEKIKAEKEGYRIFNLR